MNSTSSNLRTYNDISEYISSNYNKQDLLFNTHIYTQNKVYKIILGLYIYSSLDTLSDKIIELPDTNMSKLWCMHYNHEYMMDPLYSNYNASRYLHHLVYQLSYETDLDFHIHEYTHRLRIEAFDRIIQISETQKICITANGLILYEIINDNDLVTCNLNMSDICRLGIYKKNHELLDLLFNPINTPRRLALLSTLQECYDKSDDMMIKTCVLESYAYIQKLVYKDSDIKTALILDLSFDRTLCILKELKGSMKKSKAVLPLF